MIRRLLLAGRAHRRLRLRSRGRLPRRPPHSRPAPGASTTAPGTGGALRAPPRRHFATDRAPCAMSCTGGSTSSRPRRSDPAQDVGARIFVDDAITGPATASATPAPSSSIRCGRLGNTAADHGHVSKVRKLVSSGRIAPRGEFVNALASDSAVGAVRGPAAWELSGLPAAAATGGSSRSRLDDTVESGAERERLRGVAAHDHAFHGGRVGGTVSGSRSVRLRGPDLPGRRGRQNAGSRRALRRRTGSG